MNCKNCGFQLNENDQFCKNCGTPVNNASVQNNNEGLNTQSEQSNLQPNVMQQPINNNSQPVSPQQPSWANSYNAQPTNQAINQAPINSGNGKFIAIGVTVAIIIVGIILGVNIYNGSKNNGTSPIVSNNTPTYSVKFNGFTFKIPTSLVYETRTDSIVVGDEKGTWAAVIEVFEGSYSETVASMNEIQAYYKSLGYTSSAVGEKTIGGMSYVTMELSQNSTNMVVGITRANAMTLFGVTAYNVSNDYDYNILQTVSSILKNAEYTGEANNMSAFETPDMSKISELLK